MGMLSLALTVILLIRKKCSVYGAIALGLAVFMGLFLLDTAVGIRYWGIMKHAAGHNLTLDFSRMFQKSGQGPVETLSNIAVFVPFGFFLGGVAGVVESDGFLAPGRTCDFGRLRPLALHRVPPAGPEGGLFRGDGFGDEYGGGVCGGFDFGGGEEGGGWAKLSSDW